MPTTYPYLAPRKVATTVTSNATLAKGRHTPADATTSALTLTLPADAAAGVELSVEKVDAGTNAVTVSGTLRGSASTIVLTSQYEARTFLSEGSGSWRPISDHRTASSLSATYARVQAEAWESFAAEANGALSSDWQRTSNGQPGADMQVVSGALTNTATGTSTAAGYAQRTLSGNVTRIGAKIAFSSYTTAGGTAALVAWQNTITTFPANPTIPNAGCHFTITPTNWTLAYYTTTSNQIINGEFVTPLTADGTTTHTIELTFDYDTSTATIVLPDGTTRQVTDSHIAQYAGPYACWETFASNPSTNARARFVEVWADSTSQERRRSPSVSRALLAKVLRAAPGPVAVTYGGTESVAVPAAQTAIDATNLILTGVVVPPSGKLLATFEGCLGMTGSTNVLWACTVISSSGQSAGAWANSVVQQQYSGRVSASGVVNGTPGQVLTLRWDHFYSGTGGLATFKNGGGSGACTMKAEPLAS